MYLALLPGRPYSQTQESYAWPGCRMSPQTEKQATYSRALRFGRLQAGGEQKPKMRGLEQITV